jgi:hypothetical protein
VRKSVWDLSEDLQGEPALSLPARIATGGSTRG